MKKICVPFFAFLVYSTLLYAQGVNQMWGMTQLGGNSNNIGTIFSTDLSGGNFQQRYQFDFQQQGALPQQTELVEYNGKFYGMTQQSGYNNLGVIFEWDPVTNVYTRKFDFSTTLGNYPFGSLCLAGTKFYGLTFKGGSNNLGVLFEWDPATNVYTKKYDLNTVNGYYPYGSLTLLGGKLYGMTSGGGSIGGGVIFEWDPGTDTYTTKINFDGTNGSVPFGSLTYNAGKFYGMTELGGVNNRGVIFEWDPTTNIYTKKVDLVMATGGNPDGNNLTFLSGKFYGMIRQWGSNLAGVIFEWDPTTNIYTKKMDFTPATGTSPYGSLVVNGGKLYGLTYSGAGGNFGCIFEWDPSANIYTIKYDFASAGSSPKGTMTFSGSKFYGLTSAGGNYGSGTIFQWDPLANIYTKMINLNTSFGYYPSGVLNYYNGKFYGLSRWGGSTNTGSIFEWDPSAGTYSRMMDLVSATGYNPYGSLTLSNDKFYGTTEKGGTNSAGVIFEWDPSTNTYTKKVDMSTTDGSGPTGNLSLYNGKFYGTTNTGGSNNLGVLFEWDASTNTYTKKIDLSAANGSNPTGNLTLNGSLFYGMTSTGGSNSGGVIFEWDPIANTYTKKIDLASANGINPNGSLSYYNGKFYGTTQLGGANNLGTIFEWDPSTNIYTKKIDLSTAIGSKPVGSLLFNGNKFYGMTNAGGSNNYGVVFEWDPSTNVYTKKKDFTGLDGRAPYYGNDLILVAAPVAAGNMTVCKVVPSVTIDNSNNNTWVPIVDSLGDIIAEINANGNNLGAVAASVFIKTGPCREDAANRLYLNRNITITPQNQPLSGSVSLRLYILKAELDSLRTALNSLGQPSGVASINEVDVFKNNDACSSVGGNTALPLTATSGTYNADYYLQVNVSSFSSFYFANKLLAAILPVKLKSFTGKRAGAVNELKWEASCNSPLEFTIERSADGIHFEKIGNVVAAGCDQPFYFTDNNPFSKYNYYRLKINEPNGAINYSPVILLEAGKEEPLQLRVQPNLVSGTSINVELVTEKSEAFELMISDVTGRKMLSRQLMIQAGITNVPVDVTALASGIYWLYAVGKEGKTNMVRFVKQ